MLAHKVVPILNVSDMQESFSWFEKLGWTKSWDWGEPVDFGAVCSGANEIMLCLDGQGGRGRGPSNTTFSADGDDGNKGVWLCIFVDDVDAVHQRCVDARLEVTLPPTDMPWNLREFHVRHPDGHVFRIGTGVGED